MLDPFWIMPRVGVGIWLLAARRYDEAIDRLLQAQEMEPRLFVSSLFLGDACRFTGHFAEAHAAYQRVLDLIGCQPIILGRLGALHAAQNRPEAALKIVEELRVLAEKRHVLPSIVAGIYLALDDHDRAFLWLEKAYEERDTTLTLLGSWPAYDPVRSDPRFRQLLESVGLDE